MYVRYADDFLILIAGSKNDAELIKKWVKSALIKKCGLSLNEEKKPSSDVKIPQTDLNSLVLILLNPIP
jgi:hypothetical protein